MRGMAGVMELLRLKNISKTFQSAGLMRQQPDVHALRDVSLHVNRGEIVGLVGASGCGKSTLGRIILRLEKPDTGELWLDGKDMFKAEPHVASFAYRQKVQMIFQDPFASLNPAHDVAYHLERPLLRHGLVPKAELRSRVLDLLLLVGLTPPDRIARAYPYALSGGQRQRVAIARALAVNPQLIVADEPTSMLDVSIRMDILNLLERLRQEQGLGLIMITHDLASARYLTDRLIVLNQGRIVETGPTDQVIARPQDSYTALLLEAIRHPRMERRGT
jgi:peptide/nickel transport system ATP-binding protein